MSAPAKPAGKKAGGKKAAAKKAPPADGSPAASPKKPAAKKAKPAAEGGDAAAAPAKKAAGKPGAKKAAAGGSPKAGDSPKKAAPKKAAAEGSPGTPEKKAAKAGAKAGAAKAKDKAKEAGDKGEAALQVESPAAPPEPGPHGLLPHELPFYALPASPVGRVIAPDVAVPGGRMPFPCDPYPPEARETCRRQLIAFYEKHNPSKVMHVETILDAWSGEEELLFQRLEERYCAKPPSAAPTSQGSPSRSPGLFQPDRLQGLEQSGVLEAPTSPAAMSALSPRSPAGSLRGGWFGGQQLASPSSFHLSAQELEHRRRLERERHRAEVRARLEQAKKLEAAVKELRDRRQKGQQRQKEIERAQQEREEELRAVEHALEERRRRRDAARAQESPPVTPPKPPDAAAVRARAERMLSLIDPVTSPGRAASSRAASPAAAVRVPPPWERGAGGVELPRSPQWRGISPLCGGSSRGGGRPAAGSILNRMFAPAAPTPSSVWPPSFAPVAEVLEGAGLGRYCAAFAAEDFDLKSFAKITDADLRDLGITALGARKRVLAEVDLLRMHGAHLSGLPAKAGSPSPPREGGSAVSPRSYADMEAYESRRRAAAEVDDRLGVLAPEGARELSPDEAQAASAAADPALDFHRSTLTDFYAHFDPVKVTQVNYILAQYRGRLQEMYTAIASIYSLPFSPYLERVRAVCQAAAPGGEHAAPLLCALCSGREAELIERMLSPHGEPPDARGWSEVRDVDAAGSVFYYSHLAQEAQWDRPAALQGGSGDVK
eukprot:TRINITY_DN13455_c0_g1_i1.p1 TRINITY_DN13455_c0_g1~~TRINITY_DN13455_c0_g1_i1.p1  ORF type:complete len:805 (+),score=272.84 TRINITY_DN13455_c0_g1_i1:96-2417(+)